MQHYMSDFATQTRELIRWAGGPMWPGDNLKSYFGRLHKKTGVSVRVIRSAWQGQQLSRRTIDALREAQVINETAQLAAELEALENSMRQTNEVLYGAEIIALGDAVRALRHIGANGNQRARRGD